MGSPSKRRRQSDIAEGMEVRSTDDLPIGHVRGLRDDEFVLYHPGNPVTLVPYTAIRSVSPSAVTLQVRGEMVGEMGWSIVVAVPMPSSSLEG